MSKSLVQLAQEIERQNGAKKDYVADTSLMKMEIAHGEVSRSTITNPKKGTVSTVPDVFLTMSNGHKLEFAPTEHFHDQLGDRLGIPNRYYERMRNEAPELLVDNVNHWFQKDAEPRMIRTLDGKARAFLSKRYRPLDNYDMLQAVLPPLQSNKVEFKSCEVTDRRMYLKVLFPGIEAAIKPGDIVRAGLVISNSEVGSGSFKVEPFTYRLVCSNGMISEHILSKYHVGRGQGGSDEDRIYEILSNAAKSADDKALFMKVKEIVEYNLKPDVFNANVERFQDAAREKITGDIPKVVEMTKRQFGFSDAQGSSILRHLIEGHDLSKWGLANAVTRTAQDQEDYDDQTFFERAGGKVIELPRKDWTRIAEAN